MRYDESISTTGVTWQSAGKPVTIYGIKNCDTMKKARAWLDEHGVAYDFHDYKTAGIERERLERWSKKVGWETLLNRAGTTFRKLPDKDKQTLDAGKAMTLMLAQPSMIKRPVLDLGGGKLAGRVQAGELRAKPSRRSRHRGGLPNSRFVLCSCHFSLLSHEPERKGPQ